MFKHCMEIVHNHGNVVLPERFFLYCIHTRKLSCLKSGVEFEMNDIFYEFK